MTMLKQSEEIDVQEVTDIDKLEQEYDFFKAKERLQLPDIKKVDVKQTQFGYDPSSVEWNLPPYGYEESQIGLKQFYDHNLREKLTLKTACDYFVSCFPIIRWLPFYNWKWGYADLVAGITVGCVLVPQSMSYAEVASLPPQYGLYSSFIGAFIYSLFATSKDVCIGPVAVMSLQTAKVISKTLAKYPEDQKEITGPLIATSLALLCGIVALGAGVLRLGFLVELISFDAVAGFMTGSSLNIISGQVPALMGYKKYVHTRNATYRVIIDSLRNLPRTKLDAVFGLIPLFMLYFWKWWCSSYGPKLANKHFQDNPKRRKYLKIFYFYAQAMRNAIVIIVFTAISYGITKGRKKHRINVLGTVPSGLKDVHLMKVPEGLLAKMGSEIPAAIIVLLLEHISIAKSFGRVNNYKIVPDQELIAIGATNLIATFFHAYPATGSFSRSALKAKCNVRTPLSGLVTGACVLLALYCLTDAFYYIPSATLSAVIIHAVSDLVASYKTTWNFYKMSPLDLIAFIATVFITVFSSIDYGIYFAMCWSCALFLLNQMWAPGRFLGSVEITEVVDGDADSSPEVTACKTDSDGRHSMGSISENISTYSNGKKGPSFASDLSGQKMICYKKWVPFDAKYTREMNPEVPIAPPPPGVIVYRLSDSYTYLNCSRHYDIIFDKIKSSTRRWELITAVKKVDRPWNDPGEWKTPFWIRKLFQRKTKEQWSDIRAEELRLAEEQTADSRPLLKIVCLDFSQCSQTDATAIQSLVDLRSQIIRYSGEQVEFHICGLYAPWVKRALVNFGFGSTANNLAEEYSPNSRRSRHLARVPALLEGHEEVSEHFALYAASGTNLPFFHIDIPDFSRWDI
ncbi:probable Sulfate permease 1 [Zygosaccharomyces bailii]|nr:probable Sulfate permease 1 [Zygosaccharomyces bailii]